MSEIAEADTKKSMRLWQLNGATLKYETADGETVVVEFDE